MNLRSKTLEFLAPFHSQMLMWRLTGFYYANLEMWSREVVGCGRSALFEEILSVLVALICVFVISFFFASFASMNVFQHHIFIYLHFSFPFKVNLHACFHLCTKCRILKPFFAVETKYLKIRAIFCF